MSRFKFLKIEPVGWNENGLLVFCPAMEEPDCRPIAIARGIVRELPAIESLAREQDKTVLFCRFGIQHHQVMKFVSRLGANPFLIDTKSDQIWFSKPLI